MTGIVLLLSLLAGAAPAPAAARPTAQEMEALDRDDAAAEAAADAGDFKAALRYMDFFGHEEEEFATAMLEYGREQRALRGAVVDKLGERAWRQSAAALGVARHSRAKEGRKIRREGEIVYVRNVGADHDVPYVKVNGLWKVSVRDVLLTGVRARFGPDEKVEEADLHVLAGKMATVVGQRAKDLAGLAESVQAGRIQSAAALRQAAEALRKGPAKGPPKSPAKSSAKDPAGSPSQKSR